MRFQINYISRREKKNILLLEKHCDFIFSCASGASSQETHCDDPVSHTHRTPGPAARQAASLWCASHCSDVNTRMSLRRRLLKPPNTYMVLKEKKERENEFTGNLHKQMHDILLKNL